MATLQELVSDFLRDAQYRMAEITIRLEAIDDVEDPEYEDLENQRLKLYLFMDCVYFGYWSIIDGYNHLDWDDADIEAEMEYLRNVCGMITSPFITFVGNYPVIASSLGKSADTFPAGDPDNYIYYDQNGNPVTAPFPGQVGAIDSDTAANYFS